MGSFTERLSRFSREEREYLIRHYPAALAEDHEMEGLHRLLNSIEFMKVKVLSLGPQSLIDDYDLSTEESLRTIQHALRREAHILAEHPDLLWQQLYNRLQWEGQGSLQLFKEELERRSMQGATPWLRLKTPFRESSTLIRTLPAHEGILTCAISQDGSFIAAGYRDHTLRIWDVKTGTAHATLEGHSGPINACTISPDGELIVSSSSDHTLKVWDTKTGRELTTLRGHRSEIQDCAISPDGSFIVSASDGHTLCPVSAKIDITIGRMKEYPPTRVAEQIGAGRGYPTPHGVAPDCKS